MDIKHLSKVYRTFFFETVEGQHFMTKLEDMIKSRHEDAEKKPDYARDFTQRALGIRDVKNMISSLTADIKQSSVERSK
jgi:hypothetical protein